MPPSCCCILPARFGRNDESADTNPYVGASPDDPDAVAAAARAEAQALFDTLGAHGVDVLVVDEREREDEPCPDAVFPNNWFVVHEGTLVLCPMLNAERRRERWGDWRARLERAGVAIDRAIDMTRHERAGRALEGTGSLVFDRSLGAVYAVRSPRTDEALVRELAVELGVEPVVFDAQDVAGTPIYHTNVLLSVAGTFAIACLDRVTSGRDALRERLSAGVRTLVEITPRQMDRFCANALALPTGDGGVVLAMSETAYTAFTQEQRDALAEHATLVHAPIPTIERLGGGSVRCMIATL